MNIHEYQAKQLFAEYGIPVPLRRIARSEQEAQDAAKNLNGESWVVKAQVHAGGRGKAGGIQLVNSIDAVGASALKMLSSRLKTKQTGVKGLPIPAVLVEQVTDIARELYLSALVDRNSEKVLFMASRAGGMDIEEVAEKTPEKIVTSTVDPAAGVQSYQCREIAFALGLEGKQINKFIKIIRAIYRLVLEKDASQIEINPLVVTGSGELVALDAKINFDDNALYAHSDITEMRDPSQEDEREHLAHLHGLNYITLDGNIGCMVNGAGLAMATMDLVKLKGGTPANFLDVGGGTTTDKVAEAFKLILSDEKVKAVLVNIFGGIVRCNLIAKGIIAAIKEVHVNVPVVVRLEGTNADQGKELLKQLGLKIIAADDLNEATELVVKAVSS